MQIHQSATHDLDLAIEIIPPGHSTDGSDFVHDTSINVWPAGRSSLVGEEDGDAINKMGIFWSFTPEEAQQLGQALLDAAKNARDTFGAAE